MLARPRPLPGLGVRAAAPLAGYFGSFGSKVPPDVRVIDGGGSLLADRVDQARTAGATAMLAIVLPRYPREAIDALLSSKDWPILKEMNSEGGWPIAVWEYADHVSDGGIPESRSEYDQQMNCIEFR